MDNDNDPSPKANQGGGEEHGTVLAGTIAARINNAAGVAGVAGQSRILPLRVTTGFEGVIESSRVRNAIAYAVQAAKADPTVRHLIINISLDTDQLVLDEQYLTVVDMAYNSGALLVQSAGNGGADAIGDSDNDRSAIGQLLTVTGSGVNNTVDETFNFGRGVDLVAPGFTTSTSWTSNLAIEPEPYRAVGGTSVAAATVSGVAALVWSQNLNLTQEQVAARLLGTATNIDGLLGNLRLAGGLGHAWSMRPERWIPPLRRPLPAWIRSS